MRKTMIAKLKALLDRLLFRRVKIWGYDATHLHKGGFPRDCDWQEWERKYRRHFWKGE